MSLPLRSCRQEECNQCEVRGSLQCHFHWRDLGLFYSAVAPSLLLGVWGVYQFRAAFLLPWLAILVAFFGLIEEAVLCAHCPMYDESGRFLKCWANFGAPKIWKYRPGPMSTGETRVLYLGLFVVWGIPLVLFVISLQIVPAILFLAATVGFFMIVKRRFCPKCINLACPFNAMSEDDRAVFLDNNQELKDAFEAPLGSGP